jgi:hypothetical protein
MLAAPDIHSGYPGIFNVDPQIDFPKYYIHLNNKYPDHHFYKLDWTGYDTSVQLFESNTYDQRMNQRIQFNGDELAKCSWDFSTDWRSHGTVVTPSGNKYARNGNVGSGDSLTYHKDTEVDSRLIRYLILNFEADECPKDLLVLTGGDDPTIGIPRNVQLPVKQLQADSKRLFNAQLNAEKFEYAPQASDLNIFKTEVDCGFLAQRKKPTVDVLGRTLVPLDPPVVGNISTARVRMICETAGWANTWLNSTYLYLLRKYGEADRSTLPRSLFRNLERTGAIKPHKTNKLSTILTGRNF